VGTIFLPARIVVDRLKIVAKQDITIERKTVKGGSLCLNGGSDMSTQVWIARAICFFSLLGIGNVILAGRDTAYGRCEESSGKSIARPASAAR